MSLFLFEIPRDVLEICQTTFKVQTVTVSSGYVTHRENLISDLPASTYFDNVEADKHLLT